MGFDIRRTRSPSLSLMAVACILFAVVPRSVYMCFTSGTVRLSSRKGGPGARDARSRVARHAIFTMLKAKPTLELLKESSAAGFEFKDLGNRLEKLEFEASAVDGNARVVVDGFQRLRNVDLKSGAAEAAGGNDALAKALLGAMQEAHDKSDEATKGDVWQLYQDNNVLLQAPLNQIGAGDTAEDLWANVEKTDETVKMAEELFVQFDVDTDGYWNQAETSAVQMATEGTEMPEEAFNALLIAAAPNGGRDLSEDDLSQGLSKDQVIELYTDAERQRQLGFVLDIRKDHKAVFEKEEESTEAPAAKPGPVVVD